MPKRKSSGLSNTDKYGEIKKLKKQFRQMQEHLNMLCESSESSDKSSSENYSSSSESEADSASPKDRESNVTLGGSETLANNEKAGQSFDALGLRPDSQDNVGKDLHEEIVVRWDSFLKKGLTKEHREELMLKYKIPSNCKALHPPQLNNEVQPCLIKSALEHDRFIRALQQQLAHGLSAVGTVIEAMMPNKEQADSMKSLAEACQLFTNVHHGLSVHRRFKIIPHLNPECKKVVDNLEIDEYLFNTKFAETMKNEQVIKKASSDFKKKTWQSSFPRSSGSGTASSYHLNYRRAPPKGKMKEKRRREERKPSVHQRNYRKDPRKYYRQE